MSFVGSDLLAKLPNLSKEEADRLDYGVVKVSDEGKIEIYNKYEADMAGVAPSMAMGKNFFTEIAPCTNNRLVFGKFKKGVESGSLDHQLAYTFTYKMKPTNVDIHMLRDGGSNWIFVKAKAA